MELKTISEHYQRVIDTLQKEIVEKDKRIAELEAQVPKWHKVSEKLPKNDGLYDIAVRNKNMDCGIWLDDVAFFDGEKWGKRFLGTWEDIVMWKERELPQPPKEG